MTSRQQQLVRQFSRELDEDVKRELATALRGILETEEEEGRDEQEQEQQEEQQQEQQEEQQEEEGGRDCCQHFDLEEVGIRVQAHRRGPHHFLYTVSHVLLPEARDYIREGDVLLKAGHAVVTSISPGELRQFCQTQLTSSCVRLIFEHKDALTMNAIDGSREIEYVAIKIGYETVEKCVEAAPVGSSRPGCLACSQRLLINPSNHKRSVVKVKGKDTYLEPDPSNLTLRTSPSPCQRPQKFSRHTGILELGDSSVWVTTLETELEGQKLALRYGDPQGDVPCLWLESPPAIPDWPFLQYGTYLGDQGCPFLFRMNESESNNLMELRPLHHTDFLLCLDEDGVLVLRREGEEPIFDIQDVPLSMPSSPELPENVSITPHLPSSPVMHSPPGHAGNGTVTYGPEVSLESWDVPSPGNSSTVHAPWGPLYHLLTTFSHRRRSNSV